MKKITLALILGAACALSTTGCGRDEPIELKMEVTAPACSNHPRVQLIDTRSKGFFSEDCGHYELSRYTDGSYHVYEHLQQDGIVPFCSNMRVWHDYNGDGFVEKVELVSREPCDAIRCPYLKQSAMQDACAAQTKGYLFHTPELQQEYEAILEGIGKDEVEANVQRRLNNQ